MSTEEFQYPEPIICSDAMQKLMRMATERVARGTSAILITGETGSGKEIIARAIHGHSLRASKPWVDVNCAALPEHLVESELFGFEKGAFSGAETGKPGFFELAHTGTLFLDEIGELEPRVQVKLLRVLDGAPYYRLGGQRKISVDVRIVAATNQPLEEMVRAGRFRSDLFHRLAQIQLKVPPLRERPEDIMALAWHFLEQNAPGARWSADALQRLQSYPWPGNVRELRNVVIQAASIVHGMELTASDLPASFAGVPSARPIEQRSIEQQPAKALHEMERETILQVLSDSGGHQGDAAARLGISRRTMSRRLKHYRLDSRKATRGCSLGILSAQEQGYYRAQAAVAVELTCGQSTAIVTSANISAGGIAVEGLHNPTLFSDELKMCCMLPDFDQPLEAAGKLVWTEVCGRAGIRFTAICADLERSLKRWLQVKQQEEGWAIAHNDALQPVIRSRGFTEDKLAVRHSGATIGADAPFCHSPVCP